MSHVLSILLTLALIGIIIYIIAENDHPVQTLAWVIAIIFLPVVGLVLYFLVGHRPRRKRLVEPGELSRLKELTRQTHSAFIVPAPDNYNRLASLLQNTNQAFPMTGNAVRPYVEFYPMLDGLVADLESARDHIHFEFFKFEDDPSGRRVAEVLMRKARSGVAVVVLSNEAQEIIRVCSRALVMYHGDVRAEIAGETMTEANIMRLATGG